METKEKSRLKNRLIATLASLVVCLLLVGVTVYSATTQSVTINDNISIVTDGQVKVAIKVDQAMGPADKTLITSLAATDQFTAISSATYANLVNKDSETDTATGTGLNPTFSYANGYTFMAFKIVLTNSSTTTAANYTIAFAGFPTNAQLQWIYANDTAIASNSLLSGSLAVGASATVYTVVAVSTALDSLTAMSTTPYTLTITASL